MTTSPSTMAIDGRLSRLDGAVLLVAYAGAVWLLWWLSRRGVDVQARSGPQKELETARRLGPAGSAGLLVAALAGMIIGSELLITAARDLIALAGLSETAVGMTIIALAVSIEELGRELPAALRGRPQISYGNVNGSILAFFLFNAGVIALIRPLEVAEATRRFYLPVAIATLVVVSLLLLTRRLPRWSGVVLIALYAIFAVGGYVLYGDVPGA